MKYSYTFVRDPLLPGGKVSLPLIDISMGEYKFPVRALLDTGSPVTILHSPLAVAAGIIPDRGVRGYLFGVGGGKLTGFYQKVSFYLKDCDYTSEVFITADLHLPYCLLGQRGFFTRFRVTFDLKEEEFTITPNFQ